MAVVDEDADRQPVLARGEDGAEAGNDTLCLAGLLALPGSIQRGCGAVREEFLPDAPELPEGRGGRLDQAAASDVERHVQPCVAQGLQHLAQPAAVPHAGQKHREVRCQRR